MRAEPVSVTFLVATFSAGLVSVTASTTCYTLEHLIPLELGGTLEDLRTVAKAFARNSNLCRPPRK